MIRHVVVFRWQPGTSAAQVEEVREGLAGLRATIDGIVDYRYGDDAAINPAGNPAGNSAGNPAGNSDFAITADFADVAAYLAYRDHPQHRAFIAEVIRPIVAERHAVQFEIS